MFLKHLSLSSFRNLLHTDLNFSSRISVFVGDNGQGKTSLLEAAYLLSHNRSFRTNKLADIKSKLTSAAPLSVSGTFTTDIGEKTLSYTYGEGRRQVFLNGNRITTAEDFFGTVKIIDFTPDDLFIVRGSPTERRQFLDKILAVSDRDYLSSLLRYSKALKNRNSLLAQRSPSRSDLIPWEETLIKEGAIISKKRAELIAFLGAKSRDIYGSLVNDAAIESIQCVYESHFLKNPAPLYDESFQKDLRYGSTTVGIHRDELQIQFDTGFGHRPAKEIASQGQTRSAALALKLAGVQYLRAHGASGDPIVLLDDVESELDLGRRERLLKYLISQTSQILIATTDRRALPGIEGEFFSVKSGEVQPL